MFLHFVMVYRNTKTMTSIDEKFKHRPASNEKWSMDKPQKIHDDKKIAATGQKCHITLLFWAKIREN